MIDEGAILVENTSTRERSSTVVRRQSRMKHIWDFTFFVSTSSVLVALQKLLSR